MRTSVRTTGKRLHVKDSAFDSRGCPLHSLASPQMAFPLQCPSAGAQILHCGPACFSVSPRMSIEYSRDSELHRGSRGAASIAVNHVHL